MSTIQEMEARWKGQGKILHSTNRMAYGTCAIMMMFIGSAVLVASYINEALAVVFVAVAVISFVLAHFAAYVAIDDLIKHNRLLRDALQTALHDEKLARAELNTANVEISYLRSRVDLGCLDLPD